MKRVRVERLRRWLWVIASGRGLRPMWGGPTHVLVWPDVERPCRVAEHGPLVGFVCEDGYQVWVVKHSARLVSSETHEPGVEVLQFRWSGMPWLVRLDQRGVECHVLVTLAPEE